jgi:hypothetical protein
MSGRYLEEAHWAYLGGVRTSTTRVIILRITAFTRTFVARFINTAVHRVKRKYRSAAQPKRDKSRMERR